MKIQSVVCRSRPEAQAGTVDICVAIGITCAFLALVVGTGAKSWRAGLAFTLLSGGIAASVLSQLRAQPSETPLINDESTPDAVDFWDEMEQELEAESPRGSNTGFREVTVLDRIERTLQGLLQHRIEPARTAAGRGQLDQVDAALPQVIPAEG
jgi:hypothetical protein